MLRLVRLQNLRLAGNLKLNMLCARGEIGKHAGLKNLCFLMACRFESGRAYLSQSILREWRNWQARLIQNQLVYRPGSNPGSRTMPDYSKGTEAILRIWWLNCLWVRIPYPVLSPDAGIGRQAGLRIQ